MAARESHAPEERFDLEAGTPELLPGSEAAPARLVVEGRNGSGVAALEALRSSGIVIRSFEMERPTLEELFLRAVHAERPGA